jgi:hypothetical protein
MPKQEFARGDGCGDAGAYGSPVRAGTSSGAGLLPPAVAERLFAIIDRAGTLHRQIPEISERQELATEKVKAEQRLHQLEAHPGESSGLGIGFG